MNRVRGSCFRAIHHDDAADVNRPFPVTRSESSVIPLEENATFSADFFLNRDCSPDAPASQPQLDASEDETILRSIGGPERDGADAARAADSVHFSLDESQLARIFSSEGASVSKQHIRDLIGMGMPRDSVSAAKEWCVEQLIAHGLIERSAVSESWIQTSNICEETRFNGQIPAARNAPCALQDQASTCDAEGELPLNRVDPSPYSAVSSSPHSREASATSPTTRPSPARASPFSSPIVQTAVQMSECDSSAKPMSSVSSADSLAPAAAASSAAGRAPDDSKHGTTSFICTETHLATPTCSDPTEEPADSYSARDVISEGSENRMSVDRIQTSSEQPLASSLTDTACLDFKLSMSTASHDLGCSDLVCSRNSIQTRNHSHYETAFAAPAAVESPSGISQSSSSPQGDMLDFSLIQPFDIVCARGRHGQWKQACVIKKFESYGVEFVRVRFIGCGKNSCDRNVPLSQLRRPQPNAASIGAEALEAIRKSYSLTPSSSLILANEGCPHSLSPGELRAVMRCDALDADGVWYDAVVIKGSTATDISVKVHFNGWPKSQSKTFKSKQYKSHLRAHTGKSAAVVPITFFFPIS
jgi:hypothetical protein